MIKRLLSWQLASIFVCVYVWQGVWEPIQISQSWPAELFQEKGKNALNSRIPGWKRSRPCGWCSLTVTEESSDVIDTLENKVKKERRRIANDPLPNVAYWGSQIQKVRSAKAMLLSCVGTAVVWLPVFRTSSVSSTTSAGSSRWRHRLDLWLTFMIWLRWAYRHRAKKSWPIWAEIWLWGVRYHFKSSGKGWIYGIPHVNYIYNSYEVRVTGLTWIYTKGLGAPLVGIVEKPAQNPNLDGFILPKLAAFPVSAVLLLTGEEYRSPSRDIRLVFYDSTPNWFG